MTGRLRPFQWKHRYARRLYRIGFVQPYGAGDTEGHVGIEITGIVTRCSSPHGSDFVSLTDDADTMQAPCLEADDTSTEDLAPDQLQRFVPHLRDGTLVPRPQDPESGNVRRKRTAEDGRIEWRMSATDIHNLVRALATPYPGATCRLDVSDVAIHKVEVVPEAPGESGARQDFERRSVGNSGEMRRRRDPHSRT